MNPAFRLVAASWPEDSAALGAIRRTVFIEEQQVPEALEWDGLDEVCQHVLVTDRSGHPVGTGRIKTDGHIGRMAVLKDCRGQGIGSAILTALLELTRQIKSPRVTLHAQVTAIHFYEKHGFTVCSDEFMDAGIAHRSMERLLSGRV